VGSYPYEFDFKNGTGGAGLSVTAGSSGYPLAPLTPLILSPSGQGPLLTGQTATLTLQAYNETAAYAANVPVNVTVTGANTQVIAATTDINGQATVSYRGVNQGADVVQATATIDGFAAISNQSQVSWGASSTAPPTLTVQGATVLTGPQTSQYYAYTTDSTGGLGGNVAVTWTELSGPAAVTFSYPYVRTANVTFPLPGIYTLQATATDSFGSGSLTVGPITVLPPDPLSLTPGWIQSPADHASVSGMTPITVIAGETLTNGTLFYYPVGNPNAITVQNANTTGAGTIGTIDTTLLANGSYYVYLAANDSNGQSMASGVEIQVVGNYKPGRVTTTVTDLVVPAPGLPIQIQRTYDSLVKATSSDFGYGWSLGVNVQLDVSSENDVTLTINGQRRTFYFAPYVPGFEFPGLGGTPPTNIPNILGAYFAAYAPEPGFYGTLAIGTGGTTPNGSLTGCMFDWLMKYGDTYICYGGAGTYAPPVYVYTDPYGRV
jgi:hypothetical protein